jgi:hypothetical protein
MKIFTSSTHGVAKDFETLFSACVYANFCYLVDYLFVDANGTHI